MTRLAKVFLAFVVVAAALLMQFQRNHLPGRLSQEGYETVQAARILAATHRFGTRAYRPLETAYVAPGPDGSLPDLRHAPLHVAAVAAAIALFHEGKPGAGDRASALLHVALAILGALGAAWLARLFFPEAGGGRCARAALLFTLGGACLSLALEPTPALLAALFSVGTIASLFRLDGEYRFVHALCWAGAAGLFWGLTFLALYSALVFLPLIGIYVWRASRLKQPLAAVAVFLAVAAAAASPVPIRAKRETGNPLYQSRLLELTMHTAAYPGDSLYASASMPRPVGAFLADGGARQVLRKMGGDVGGYVPAALTILGPLSLTFFLGAGLIRFTDGRVNRLRTLGYALLGAHVLGLALFFPADEGGSALFVHAPLVAALGAGFLETVIRARRVPRFQAAAALLGWTSLACVPGAARYFTDAPVSADAPALFDWLAVGDVRMRRFERAKTGVLASDIAAEVAFRRDVPTVFLPADAVDLAEVEKRLGRRVEGILVGPDPASSLPAAWGETRARIDGYSAIVGAVPPPERAAFGERYPLIYPSSLGDSLDGYTPASLAEGDSGRSSLVFWYNEPASR